MKFSLALLAFLVAGALAQRHSQVVQNIELSPGLMYVYRYHSRVLTGIPMLADQYSGTELKADLVLQPRSEGLVAMKLTNIKFGNINDDVPANYEEEIQMVHRQVKDAQRELSKPIRFLQVNGKVKQLEAEASEPEWSLNIKKSIISLFNLNLTPQKIIRAPRGNLIPKPISYQDLTYYGLYERGIAGICETVYEVKAMPDPKDPTPEHAFVLNVTKTRNYDNCLTAPTQVNENYDIRGCQAYCQKEKSQAVVQGYYPVPAEVSDPMMTSCPCNKMMGQSPVDQYNHVKYNISTVGARPVIESLLSEGKVVYKTNGEQIMVVTHQNATLLKMVPSQQMQIPSIQRPVRHQELEFRLPIAVNHQGGPQPIMDIPMMHIFEAPNYKEWAKNLPLLFDKVADQIISAEVSNSKNTMIRIVEAVRQLSVLPGEVLEAMYKEIAQEGRSQEASPKEQIKRKLFLEVLPQAGTNHVAKFIKQLIQANLVSHQEAASLVETLPQNMFLPDTETLDSYLELSQNDRIKNKQPLFASTLLSFAKMVQKACVRVDQNPGELPNGKYSPQNKRNLPAQMIVKPADPRSEHYHVQPLAPGYTKVIRQPNRPKRDVIQEEVNTYQSQQQQDQYHQQQQLHQQLHQQQQQYGQQHGQQYGQQHGQHYDQQHGQHYGQQHGQQHQSQYYYQQQQQQYAQRLKQQDRFEDIIQQDVCQEADIVKYVHLLGRLLQQADNFQEKLAYIEALTHLQVPQVLPILEPYVSGRITPEQCPGYPVEHSEQRPEECNFLRTSTILALERMVMAQPQQIQALLLPVFRDASEPYQIRVAAFSTLQWTNPESQVLESIASQLHREPNKQVRSFVYTSLEKLANLTTPCYKPLAQSARKVFEFLPEVEKGMQYSASKVYDNYDHYRQTGLTFRKEYIASNVSTLPRHLMLELASNDGPFMDNLFKLSVHSKGFEKIVKRFLQPHGVLSGMFESLVGQKQQQRQEQQAQRQKRSVSSVEQALETLKQRLNFKHRGDEVPKAELLFQIFDKTSQISLDEHQIKEIMEQLEETLQDWAQALADGYSGHFVKLFMPASYFKMVPTEIGIPVTIGHYHPLILSLKVDNAKLEVSKRQQTILPQVFNISAMITPQVMYSSIITVETHSSSRKLTFGTIVQKHTQMVLPLELSVGVVQPKSLVRVSIIPSLPQKIFHHKSEARTYITSMGMTWSANRDILGQAKLIKSQVQAWKHQKKVGHKAFGIGLNIELESENEWHDQLFWQTQYAKKHGFFAALLQLFKNPQLKNRELTVRLEEDQKHPTTGIDFTFRYKKVTEEQTLSDVDNSDDSEEYDESDSDVSSGSSSASESSESSVTSEESDESTTASKSTSHKQSRKQKLAKKLIKQMKEQLQRHPRSKVHVRVHQNSVQTQDSSESSSESSSYSSQEEGVFNYEDVMALILGEQIKEHNIHKIVKQLIRKTEQQWKEEREQESQEQVEKARVPATVAHDLAITAVLRGPRPTFFATNFLFVHTIDQRTFWYKMDAHGKSPVGIFSSQPQLLCSEAVVSFPQIPGEFYYDPTTLQDLQAKIYAKIGWGPQCTGEGGVILKGIMEKIPVEQQVTEKAFNWFYRQCKVDRAEGKPASPACQKAIQKESYLNQLVLDIKYEGVPKYIQNLTQKLDLAIKHNLYEYLQTDFVDVQNPEQQIRIKAQFFEKVPQIPMVDVFVQRPHEEYTLQNVFVPKVRPFSAVKPMKEILLPLLYGYKHHATCVLMEKGIQTFDNVTLDLPENQCQYLLAMDCSPQEKFAIFATQLDQEARTKIVQVNVQGQVIKLLPPQQQNLIQIVVDGKEESLTPHQPRRFENVRIYLRKSHSEAVAPIAVIEAPEQDLKVLYDGKNVKVEAGRRYTGKTCGLCANNDHETEDELVGPNKCIYEEVEDFLNSYALAGRNCEKVAEPIGQVRCPQGVSQQPGAVQVTHQIHTRQGPHGTTTVIKEQTDVRTGPGQKVPACQYRRTQTIIRDQMICFSTKPVFSCGSCRAQGVEQVPVQYHCLPRASPFTKQLMAEAEVKILTQLVNKRVDLTEELQVPTSCVPVGYAH